MTHSCPTRRSSDLVDGLAFGKRHDGLLVIVALADESTEPLALAGLAHCVDARDLDLEQLLDGRPDLRLGGVERYRSEEQTSELQSLMRISYAVFCLKKKNKTTQRNYNLDTR